MPDFNASPYWDDFEATNGALEKNYMRILFRPGFAIQARELTQIQSIIQNQIKLFGDHIFKDGSPVLGGHLTLDTGVKYIKLEQLFQNLDIDLEDFLGLTVFNTGSPKTRAKVIQTFSSSADRTLLIRYLRGSGFTGGQTISTAGGSSANVVASNFTGIGSIATINDGVFYVDGFFVTVPKQTIVLDPYSSTPTYRIGLEIDDEIVTESVDNALLDPAQEAFNYQAPGAHRYQFALNLAKRTLDSVDDSRFFELLRVENGIITKQVSYPIYSELEKTFARRTYDESGNYAVRPFRINLSANTPAGASENTSTFIINVEPGKAYVNGFEFETIGTTKIPAPRARTTKSHLDYGLSVFYGNRIQLANIFGSANGIVISDGLTTVDVHCVSNNEVNLSGTSEKYFSTRIGTAKIRNIDRVGSDQVFYTYLTDVNFDPIISSANGSSNTTAVKFKPHFSSTANAYQNGTITLIDTSGSVGNTAKIVSYDGTAKVAYISPAFKTSVVDSDRFVLTMPLSSTKSLVVANTTSFSAANLQSNVSVGSKTTLGNTFIEDSSYDIMVYPLPNYYIKRSSDVNVEFYRRLVLREQSFTGNGALTVSLASGQTFDFGTNGSTLSDSAINKNIIVVASSGANVGKILDMTEGARSVYRTSASEIVLYTNDGSGSTFTGDVYLTTKITNANTAASRSKTLIESNAAITAFDTLASATSVNGFSEVKINSSNGIVWHTSANVVNKIPGEKQPLFLSDVIRINKIYDSGNVSHAPNVSNKIDVTDRYTFDSGQKDGYYDHASIILKPGSQPPSGQTVVFLDYFTHSTSPGGYISGKSYNNTLYESEQIPIYKSSSGELYNLRDSIDFRPVRTSGVDANPYVLTNLSAKVNTAVNSVLIVANTSLTSNALNPPIKEGTIIRVNGEQKTVNSVINATTISVSSAFATSCTNGTISVVTPSIVLQSSVLHKPDSSFELDFEYYLPRIDKVIATKEKEFKLISGVPSLNPQEPFVDENAMTIYKLKIPAYTATLQSVDLEYLENRRYTMRDISKIDERLALVEKDIELRKLENDTIADPPKSPETPTINKPIYGMVVDEFVDLSVVDVNNDFKSSIENGLLSAIKIPNVFSLSTVNTSDVKIRDKFITLNYNETPVVSQGNYSNTGNSVVQTAIIAKFEGFATLTPESDYFYSIEHQPAITDSYGRRFELPQTPPPLNPAIDQDLVYQLGANNYNNLLYNDYILVGSDFPAVVTRTITVPDFSNLPTATEPTTTTEVNISVTAVAPTTMLTNWTGVAVPINSTTPEEPVYQPGWREESIYVAPDSLSLSGGLSDFSSFRQDRD